MPTDESSIDELIGRFFSAFDNRGGRRPRREIFETLFASGAVVASHGGSSIAIGTVEEFARPRIELLNSGRLIEFCEWETDAETTVTGTLATRRSRYAKRGQLDGKPYDGAGTKNFQLAFLDGQWRIVALSWIDDSALDDQRAG